MALTALVVEDNAYWRGLQAQALLDSGVATEVYTAENAQDAWSYVYSPGIDIILSDLHMGGEEYDGDRTLHTLATENLQIPFVVVSGTMANNAKVTLAQEFPSAAFLDKELALDPQELGKRVEQIYLDASKHHHSPQYVDALGKAKVHLDAISDVMIRADSIKGRVFSMLAQHDFDHHDREILQTAQYCGATPQQTATHIHTVKNMLTGMAHGKYSDKPAIYKELLLAADEIKQALTAPTQEELPLHALAKTTLSNLVTIYDRDVSIEISKGVKVKHPNIIANALYSLVENALEASVDPIQVSYDSQTNRISVYNTGVFPEKYLDSEDKTLKWNIPSSKPFGSARGIRQTVQALEEIDQVLTYTNIEGAVGAHITLQGISTVKTSGKNDSKEKPIVLFYDHEGGSRVNLDYVLDDLNPSFAYVEAKSAEHLLEQDLENVFLVIAHPGSLGDIFGHEVVKRMPNSRYFLYTGFDPGFWDEGFPGIYRSHSRSREDRTSPKPDIMQYIDVTDSHLPFAKTLNAMIGDAYLRFQSDLK